MLTSHARAGLVLGLCLAAMGCQKGSDDLTLFVSEMDGSKEIPARATTATGTAGFTYDGNRISYSLEVRDINAVTQAHIHSGSAAVNGPIRVWLFGTPGAPLVPTGSVDGILAQGSFGAADVLGISFEQLLSEMRAGTAYVNVHTTTYPGGEVRGQLRLLN